MRKWIYKIGVWFILAPIMPFYILRQCLETSVKFIDWAIEGRAVPNYLAQTVDRLEVWSLQGRRR